MKVIFLVIMFTYMNSLESTCVYPGPDVSLFQYTWISSGHNHLSVYPKIYKEFAI